MLVVQDAFHSADLPYGPVVTLGSYDGIHRGQRMVIERVVSRARETGVPAVVITFDPHPRAVLSPETAPNLLTTADQRQEILAGCGVDQLLVVRFTRELSRMPAESFVREFLVAKLAISEVYVGSGFSFGRRRRGTVELLQEIGRQEGFLAVGIDELLVQGEPVSSTRVRRAILEGKVELASELLGRPYALAGTITRGDRMGMRLGWPTINLGPDNEILPCDGVYAGRAFFPSFPATFDCVTNVGNRPTVYENYQRVVESHILGFSADVYGERVEVSFHKRLREEKMFSTVMDLSAQIGRDVEAAREYFAARRRLEE